MRRGHMSLGMLLLTRVVVALSGTIAECTQIAASDRLSRLAERFLSAVTIGTSPGHRLSTDDNGCCEKINVSVVVKGLSLRKRMRWTVFRPGVLAVELTVFRPDVLAVELT